MTYRIAVIVGSLRRDSHNQRLAQALMHMGAADFYFEQLHLGQLPLYNQDEEAQPCAAVRHFKGALKAAQGVLFVTPEYNRSIPGVLKNALDQASRPYGDSAWTGKPAGVIGMSIGAAGTALAQQHLRNVLVFLNMPTLAQPEAFLQAKDGFFNADGSIGEASRGFVQGWLDSYQAWVRQHSSTAQ